MSDSASLPDWTKTVAFVVALLTMLGMAVAGGQVVATELWGLTTVERHQADILRIERKLDCVLFQFPRNCRQNVRPAEPFDPLRNQ